MRSASGLTIGQSFNCRFCMSRFSFSKIQLCLKVWLEPHSPSDFSSFFPSLRALSSPIKKPRPPPPRSSCSPTRPRLVFRSSTACWPLVCTTRRTTSQSPRRLRPPPRRDPVTAAGSAAPRRVPRMPLVPLPAARVPVGGGRIQCPRPRADRASGTCRSVSRVEIIAHQTHNG